MDNCTGGDVNSLNPEIDEDKKQLAIKKKDEGKLLKDRSLILF